jgi:predicted RNA-binding protein with PUA-like domain
VSKKKGGTSGSAQTSPRWWLMKTEPDVFSIDDLAKKKRAPWDGVRNFQARNHMAAMKAGDMVLFYHSSTEPKGVVGVARVVREAYPDHTQFDPKSDHYDPKSKPDAPRWSMVDVEFVEKLGTTVTLDAMKADPKLAGMLVTRRGMRLSVQPVETAHAARVLAVAGSRQRVVS